MEGALSVDELHLQISNNVDEIDVVNERFNAFAAAHAIPDAVRRTFDIAFDDLLNNVVSYGFDDERDHSIWIDIRLDGECLEACISDEGVPFDPFARAAPDTTLDIDDRDIGGLGIHLVRSMMDSATYERRDGRNRVVITKTWVSPEPHDTNQSRTKDHAD